MLGMRRAARDMAPEKLSLLGRLFSQWISEEAAEPEHQTNDALPHAAGSLMMTKDGRALFVRRAAGKDHAGAWSIPAGMSEGDEAPWQTAMRETHEEVGDCGMEPRGMKLLDHTLQPNVGFTTYGYQVDNEFQPTLDAEHDSYMWAPLDQAPHPLHPGLEQTIHDFAMDPLTDKGQKIMESMKKQYGPERGEQVFYASKNKGKIEGVDNSLTARDRIVPNPSDRFTLTEDDKILDRQTGVSYNANDAMRIMFAPDKFINKDATAGKVDVPSPTPIVNKVDTAAWRMPKIEARGEDQVAPNWQTPRFPQQDAGTSEGARKAALTRGHGGHAPNERIGRTASGHGIRALATGSGSRTPPSQTYRYKREGSPITTAFGNHSSHEEAIAEAKRRFGPTHTAEPYQARTRRIGTGDAGTSEGARKAAQTRKSGGGEHKVLSPEEFKAGAQLRPHRPSPAERRMAASQRRVEFEKSGESVNRLLPPKRK
jgi:8-oxo-dGTP pyrophosphatase MutT (NUDIX family)